MSRVHHFSLLRREAEMDVAELRKVYAMAPDTESESTPKVRTINHVR